MVRAVKSTTVPSNYYIGYHVMANNNQYDKITNPNGFFSWSCAENPLTWDLIKAHFKKCDTFVDKSNLYTCGRGFFPFLEIMSEYVSDLVKYNVSMDNIVVTNGSAAAINSLLFCICEYGDYILCKYCNDI